MAAKQDEVQFTSPGEVPPLGTAVEVVGCRQGLCTAVVSCREGAAGCPRPFTIAEADLARAPLDPAGQLRDADAALAVACPETSATSACLLARAAVRDARGDAQGARADVVAAMRRAPREAGGGPRLAVAGVTAGAPSIGDGERVVALCGGQLVEGRARVRAERSIDGWAFAVTAPCPVAARTVEEAPPAVLVAGLPDAPRRIGEGARAWRLGAQRLSLEPSTLGGWWLVDVTGARAHLPPLDPWFVGDLDGDDQFDAILGVADPCTEGRAVLLLSTASPRRDLPVRVGTAVVPMIGACD